MDYGDAVIMAYPSTVFQAFPFSDTRLTQVT